MTDPSPLLAPIFQKAASKTQKIALSEGSDPRVIEAALKASAANLASIILVGAQDEIEPKLQAHENTNIEIIDPKNSEHRDEFADLYFELRSKRGVTREEAQKAVLQPHIFSALMVRCDYAGGTVGGAVLPTSEIVRTALQLIGTHPEAKLVSSFFLMLLQEDYHPKKDIFVFSDAGLVIDPDAKALSEIAQASARSYASLLEKTPRLAMLSFSTHGSAQHPNADKVVEATRLLNQKLQNTHPDWLVDGELQFDAAFIPKIAKSKTKNSPLEGNANIFIFPNLDAGNIGYKIAQRIGGAIAIGPILQGLAKPANDLSRGCNADDILNLIAVTAAQANSTD